MIAKQVRVASQIDAAMLSVLQTGKDDLAMFVAMGKHMEDFRWLVDSAGLTAMDKLCRRYDGLIRYAQPRYSSPQASRPAVCNRTNDRAMLPIPLLTREAGTRTSAKLSQNLF